jgi:peptidoglycan hydrolase-like protein with peptidoglycan-binding domain
MASTGAKIIFWTLGVAAVGGLGYWLYKTYGGGKKVKLTQEEIDKMIADAKASGEIKTTTPDSTINVVSESFPISVGMTGEKIKALQVKLAVSPTTGYFGNKTNAAVQAKGYKVPLSEADYNKIMGVTVAPSGQITFGDPVYLKADQIVVYSYPEGKSDYIKGIIKKSDVLDKKIGSFVSDASNGFAKINLIATGRKLVGNEYQVGNFTGTFYLNKSQLSRTPY